MNDEIKKTVRAIWHLARNSGLLELEAELQRIEAEAYNRGVEDAEDALAKCEGDVDYAKHLLRALKRPVTR